MFTITNAMCIIISARVCLFDYFSSIVCEFIVCERAFHFFFSCVCQYFLPNCLFHISSHDILLDALNFHIQRNSIDCGAVQNFTHFSPSKFISSAIIQCAKWLNHIGWLNLLTWWQPTRCHYTHYDGIHKHTHSHESHTRFTIDHLNHHHTRNWGIIVFRFFFFLFCRSFVDGCAIQLINFWLVLFTKPPTKRH